MGRDEFQGVSEQFKAGLQRMEDARVLHQEGRWRGAMYLSGYSIECLLKVKLMRMFGCHRLGELEATLIDRGLIAGNDSVFTHQLEPLLRLCGVFDRLRADPVHWRAFCRVNRWIPAWRYSANLSNQKDADDFLQAIDATWFWIEHNV